MKAIFILYIYWSELHSIASESHGTACKSQNAFRELQGRSCESQNIDSKSQNTPQIF